MFGKIEPTTYELQLLRICVVTYDCRACLPAAVDVHISSFVDEFANITALLTSECSDNIIVCGDMNCPGPNDSSVDAELDECF